MNKSSALTDTTIIWQICPLCNGLGKVQDYILTGVYPMPESILSNGEVFDCPVCNGKRIIKINSYEK